MRRTKENMAERTKRKIWGENGLLVASNVGVEGEKADLF
jgi:hypothetical protein